jgi:hypothetical protein
MNVSGIAHANSHQFWLQLARTKKLHFQDRIARVKSLVNGHGYSEEKKNNSFRLSIRFASYGTASRITFSSEWRRMTKLLS